MSAMIITFPGAPPTAVSRPAGEASPIDPAGLATKFADHFLPIVQASVDLLQADEIEFERRCRNMIDNDGTAMVEDLCAELQNVGRQMQVLIDGLDLTRARLRTAMSRLADRNAVVTDRRSGPG